MRTPRKKPYREPSCASLKRMLQPAFEDFAKRKGMTNRSYWQRRATPETA